MAVTRSAQVDAVDLDGECLQLFRNQLIQAVSHLPAGIFERIEPEVSALLRLAVYVIPLYTSSSLIGQQLLGIKFISIEDKDPRKKVFLYGTAVVLTKWLGQRWKNLASLLLNEDSGHKITNTEHYVETALKVINFMNSLIFLVEGLYPTLLHRILRLRTESILLNEPHSFDLSTLTRELLWHSFAELMMFVLPLFNIHRFKRLFMKWKTLDESVTTESHAFVNACAVCNKVPVLPHTAKCNHMFCYYCLEANILADPHFQCPLCSSYVNESN